MNVQDVWVYKWEAGAFYYAWHVSGSWNIQSQGTPNPECVAESKHWGWSKWLGEDSAELRIAIETCQFY